MIKQTSLKQNCLTQNCCIPNTVLCLTETVTEKNYCVLVFPQDLSGKIITSLIKMKGTELNSCILYCICAVNEILQFIP